MNGHGYGGFFVYTVGNKFLVTELHTIKGKDFDFIVICELTTLLFIKNWISVGGKKNLYNLNKYLQNIKWGSN